MWEFGVDGLDALRISNLLFYLENASSKKL
jgi:hypothetical protein